MNNVVLFGINNDKGRPMYLSMKSVCARYDVTRDTIYKWIAQGKFPASVKVNGATRWLLTDLQNWEPK